MKEQNIRRFSPVEIFLHWANAVLYLLLACTGTLMLIYRIFETELIRHEILSLTHRIAGISLIIVLSLIFILSIFKRSFGQLWNTFRHCLTWSSSDFIWLMKVPFNMLFKRTVLPLAGRFNAGQKMHLLVLLTLLLCFGLSGLVIIIAPGLLAAWAIHLFCFIPAAMFLLLHLFLSLINPSTRKSLPAIFTGFVTAEYASRHHPLWMEKTELEPHGSYVSWRALTGTVIICLGLTALIISKYGVNKAREKFQPLISQRATTSIFSGPLAKSHANNSELKYCTTCHQYFLTPSSDSCLSCHDIIRERTIQQSGYHGKLTGQCRSCHPEHAGEDADIRNFDTTQFDHNLADFELAGKHRQLTCQQCHLIKINKDTAAQTKYIGLNFKKCSDCHTDPHLHRFEQACALCHSEQGWKEPNLIFSHNKDSQFKIDQIHSHLTCASCHNDIEPPLFKPLPTTCEKCHDNIEKLSHGIASQTVSIADPHAGRVTCTQCHQTDIYDQPDADYAYKCKSCHNDEYEQLYYNWNQVFNLRKSQAETLLSRLRTEDTSKAEQIASRIKEANETSFHNIHLANELWDQVFSEIPVPEQ